MPVVFPVHPRSRKYIEDYGMLNRLPPNIIVTEPLGYLDMIRLMAASDKIHVTTLPSRMSIDVT